MTNEPQRTSAERLTFVALNLTFIRGPKAFPVFHADGVTLLSRSTLQNLFSVEQAFVGRAKYELL